MKTSIFILTFLLINTLSRAQDFTLGPKIGINSSSLTNTDKIKTLDGFTGGGFFVYSIVENFGVSLDALYSAEGAKYSTAFYDDSKLIETEYKLRINYIRLPLLANVFFGSLGDKVMPKISLGPSFGFLTGVKNSTTVTITENNVETSENNTNTNRNGFSGSELSAIIGAGLNFKIGNLKWLNLDLRYSIGATEIYEVKHGDKAIKNNVFSICLGIGYGIE